MLIVTNATQSEVLLESNYEKHEEQNGAALQISFSSFSFAENVGHELLDFEVLLQDEDGHEYKVKQYKQIEFEKQIVATHVFFDLCNQWKYDVYGGTHTFEEFATWLFKDTGWTYQNSDVTGSQVIPNFGNNNVLQMINILRDAYNCEYKILPNNVIQFGTIIGQDNDLQYRYKHNISQLTQSIDTTSLKTQIRGIGGNGVAVTYTSPLAENPLIGVRVAETLEDGTITTEETMIEALKEQLNDVPETIIEISVTEVDGELGDYVWIIHERMNLEYQTRVISKKTTRSRANSTITVGNTVRKDITDILVSQKANIDEHKKITRSKFEQTNELIAMEVETLNESIAEITIKGSEEIEARVMDKVNEEFAAINLRADTIESNVQDAQDNISKIEQTSQQVQTTVQSQETTINDLETRVSSAESVVTQAAAEVSSKVSYSDFNGETITSLINQTPSTVTIDANKINLNGAVIVNGNISGATDIETTNNVAVGNALYFGGVKGSYDFIKASGYMEFQSWGDFHFNGGNMYLNNAWIPTSRTDGLGFGYSTGANRLYVSQYGVDVGYIPLTPLY